MFAGLVTLEEMKEKRETLVREREKQIAAKLPTNEVYGLSTMCHSICLMLPCNRVPQLMSLEAKLQARAHGYVLLPEALIVLRVLLKLVLRLPGLCVIVSLDRMSKVVLHHMKSFHTLS